MSSLPNPQINFRTEVSPLQQKPRSRTLNQRDPFPERKKEIPSYAAGQRPTRTYSENETLLRKENQMMGGVKAPWERDEKYSPIKQNQNMDVNPPWQRDDRFPPKQNIDANPPWQRDDRFPPKQNIDISPPWQRDDKYPPPVKQNIIEMPPPPKQYVDVNIFPENDTNNNEPQSFIPKQRGSPMKIVNRDSVNESKANMTFPHAVYKMLRKKILNVRLNITEDSPFPKEKTQLVNQLKGRIDQINTLANKKSVQEALENRILSSIIPVF